MAYDITGETARLQVRKSLSLVAPPSGFGWDFSAHPINIYKDGPRKFATDIDLRAKIPSDVWNGPVYYVSPTGSNANAGTSRATAVRSLWKARQLLEASAAIGGIFIVDADPNAGFTWWDRANDFNDTGAAGGGGAGGVAPTKPFAMLSSGGVNYMGAVINGLAWTLDATSKTYSATRSAVATVIDISSFNRWGIFKRLTKIAAGADLAATRTLVGAAPGSYAVTAANEVVIRLEADAAVSDTTVRVILNTVDALKLGAVHAYISGFGLAGSTLVGAVSANVAATRNVVMEDCDASFAGQDGGVGKNNYAIDNMTGLFAMRRCTGGGALADVFNFHGVVGQGYGLMIDCKGVDAGHDGASPVNLSNQIVTLHEAFKLISLNTDGTFSSGGCVRNINSSQHWDLGSSYGYDRGDIRFSGGTQISTGIVMNDTAEYWGDCITVRGCQQSFYATAAAKIHLRDPIEMGGVRAGPIDAY